MNIIWEYLVDIYYRIATLPVEGSVGVAFIISNFSIFLSVVIFIFLSRYRDMGKRLLSESLRPKLERFFRQVLCGKRKMNGEEISQEYYKIISKSSDFITELSFEVLQSIKKCEIVNFENYNKMFMVLGFEDFLSKKASFSSPSQRYKTLNKIKEFELKSLDAVVMSHKYSKNINVRKEARLSYLLISQNDPYRFFEEFQEEVTYWDTIELMNLLNKIHEKGELKSLSTWLVISRNPSMIIFLIKAISHFKQIEAKELLIEKLDDDDDKIREEAIRALGALGCKDVEPKLLKTYKFEISKCQKAIIKAIECFNTRSSLTFLRKEYEVTKDIDIEMDIANTISKFDGGMQVINDLEKQSISEFKKQILQHVKTPLIKFKASYA